MTTHEPEFDAIIVGSGPAGSTIARELSRRNKKVLVLERGGNAALSDGLFATASVLNAIPVSDNLRTARAFTTGGSTALYFAVADAPPLETFRAIGVDLSREYDDVKRELPLAILPDELLGPQTLRLRESAAALGYEWKKSTMLVDLSRCASGYAYEAKWNARSFLSEAVEHGATLVTHARVQKVLTDDGRAIGVEYRARKTKKVFEVRRAYGAKIVLAAGGAASPVILRESGMKNVATDGFYCHPGFGMFGMIPGLKAGQNFVGSMGAEIEHGVGVGDGNFHRAGYRAFMLGNRRFIRAFLHSRSAGIGVMVKEGLGGGLREDGSFYKQLQKDDLAKLDRGAEVARRILQHAGAKNIFRSAPIAAHIGGTIRIQEHLDENLQTEWRDLHVCDGSIMPENAKVSPALTLVCLGKYLANRLAQA